MRSLAIFCVLLMVCTTVGLADDWTRWRGPKGDGHTAEKGLMDKWPDGGPKLLWTVSGLGKGWTSATTKDGNVYVTGLVDGSGVMFCFDDKGKQKWKVGIGKVWDKTGRMGFPGTHSTPTIDDGKLYLMTGQGVASCWNAKTGKRVWAVDTTRKFGGRNIQWGFSESPLVVDNVVIVTPGGSGGSVVALNKKTGATIWTSRGLSEASAYCTPILIERGKSRVLVTMLKVSIVGLDFKTGRTLWKIPFNGKYGVHANTPLLSKSGYLFCCSGYGHGAVALRLSKTGRQQSQAWRQKILDTHHGGTVVIGDHVYGTSDRRPSKRILCLDVKTGNKVSESRAIRKGSIITAEGLLYCYGESGKVALVKADPGGMTELGSFDVSEGSGEHWAHPSIANGVLYIRHGSHMMAYDIKKK